MKGKTTITITETRPTKSQKNLSVKDQNGQWFYTKSWDLANHIGQTIEASITPQQFTDGTSIDWINDYTFSGAGPAPAHQVDPQVTGRAPAPYPQERPAPVQAPPPYQPPQQQAPTPPPNAGINREASITAQALCKCVIPGTPAEIFAAYKSLYQRLVKWDGRHDEVKPISQPTPPPAPDPVQQPGPDFPTPDEPDFTDDIPF